MVEGGLDPPPGVTPNFDNPEKTVYNATIATQALCISIVGAFLALRIYVRLRILRAFTLEDYLILAGFLLAVGYSVDALVMTQYGGGINQWEVPKEKIVPFGITVYTTMVLYGPCALSIKASILVFLARIFAPAKRAVLGLHIILGGLVAYYLPVLIIKTIICRPISKFWLGDAMEGQCFNQRALILADSVISVISDMVIFAAPIPLTCNLHMQKRKRLKVASVFGVGGLACICSAIRLIDIIQNGNSENQTLAFMRINLWGIAEVYIGLITACLPVLPAFYKHHFGKSESTGYSNYGYSHNRTIEMLSSRRGGMRSTIGTQKSTTDCGSDEDVLITDMLGPKISSRSKRLSHPDLPVFTRDSHRSFSPAPQSPFEAASITKTVEIKQTYD